MVAMLGGIHSAHAHGIAGNRFFPGTLSFDDPAVADEAILPNFASEPLNQLVPLVEFSFDSPRGEKTVATMNPGLSYVAVSWQLASEAIVPLNAKLGILSGLGRSCFYFSMS